MSMGCNESREKEKPPINLTFAIATPLPLHIYEEYTQTFSVPSSLQTSPPTSPMNAFSIVPSPTSRASPTSRVSPTAVASFKISTPTGHFMKLKAIAHYKFPEFKKFPSDVQQQILLHIDKEMKIP